MGKFLCQLLTRGKHKFLYKRRYYRCRWCGELRFHVLRENKGVKDESVVSSEPASVEPVVYDNLRQTTAL